MYAVQLNQIESVNILLEHGAEPNSNTHIPTDRCFFNLNISEYTPLAYAARNSSFDIIQTLLGRGASPYIYAIQDFPKKRIYPFDWLEENPILKQKEKIALRQAHPKITGEDAKKQARKMNTEAESLYRDGKIIQSYDLFYAASKLDEDNYNIKNNLSLLAIINQKYDIANKAIFEVVNSAAGHSAKSSAYYNFGKLIVKRHVTHANRFRINSEGLEAFSTSATLKNTHGRSKTIIDYVDNNSQLMCGKNNDFKVFHHSKQRLKFLPDSPLEGGHHLFVLGPENRIAVLSEICLETKKKSGEITAVCAEQNKNIKLNLDGLKIFSTDNREMHKIRHFDPKKNRLLCGENS